MAVPVLLYGSETWVKNLSRIQASEIGCTRRDRLYSEDIRRELNIQDRTAENKERRTADAIVWQYSEVDQNRSLTEEEEFCTIQENRAQPYTYTVSPCNVMGLEYLQVSFLHILSLFSSPLRTNLLTVFTTSCFVVRLIFSILLTPQYRLN